MMRPLLPWAGATRLFEGPTLGDLIALCEENYQRLNRLVPRLSSRRGEFCSFGSTGLALHVEILEQAPYTTHLRLTYFFAHQDGDHHRVPLADPDAVLRAYHDSRQVEVLTLRQTALPVRNDYQPSTLEAKWRANCFLAKWLDFCRHQGHRFTDAPAARLAPDPSAVVDFT